jgi:hypothetical protein
VRFDADTDADTHSDTDTHADAYADTNADTNAYADRLCVQPIPGRDEQCQLEHGCDPNHGDRYFLACDAGHAGA